MTHFSVVCRYTAGGRREAVCGHCRVCGAVDCGRKDVGSNRATVNSGWSFADRAHAAGMGGRRVAWMQITAAPGSFRKVESKL